jgi:hypothetical protein
MFEIFHHTDVAENPEEYHLRPEDVANLSEMFGLVQWSDLTGNTPEVRRYRFARMQHLLAELDLPDPTMQGDDLRRSEARAELARGEAVRQMVLAGLEINPRHDVPLAEVLAELLEHDEHKIRAGAARMMGLLRARESLYPLLAALKDPHEWVRGEAAWALGRLGDPAAIPHIKGLLSDETFPGLPEHMQAALRRLRRVHQGLELEKEYLWKKFNPGVPYDPEKADSGQKG